MSNHAQVHIPNPVQPRKTHRVALAIVSLLVGGMVGYVVTCYLAVLVPPDRLWGLSSLYKDTSKLVVTDDGVGSAKRFVEVRTSPRVREGHQMVLWVVAADSDGVPNYARVYPYRKVAAGTFDRSAVDIGGSGAGSLGASYVVQVCDVTGTALDHVDEFFTAIRQQTKAEKVRRAKGISLVSSQADFACTADGSKVVQRTV